MNRLSFVSAARKRGFGVFTVKKKPFFTIYKYLCTTSESIKAKDEKNISDRMELEQTKSKLLQNNYSSRKINNRTQYNTISRVFSSLDYNKVIDLERAKQLIQNSDVTVAYELLKKFSRNNIRNIDVLLEISDKICDSADELDFKKCSDVLYSLACLTYKNQKLINKISDQIMKCPTMKSEELFAASILHSYGVLKYRNPEIMDHLIKFILNNNNLKAKYFLTSLLTLAIVNHKSSYLNLIIEELSKLGVYNFSDTKSYLDFVWGCVILNEFRVNDISEVLSQRYINQLNILGDASRIRTPINLKLQNINSAARNLIPNYNGPFLENSFIKPQVSRTKLEFNSKVLDGLCHIFPKNGYLIINKDVNSGFCLDIECCMDSEGKPVLLKDSKDLNRIGILLFDFNDFCLNDEKTLTGISSFKQKIIKALNYKLVTIPYLDFIKFDKVDEKVKYLKKKLEDVCTVPI